MLGSYLSLLLTGKATAHHIGYARSRNGCIEGNPRPGMRLSIPVFNERSQCQITSRGFRTGPPHEMSRGVYGPPRLKRQRQIPSANRGPVAAEGRRQATRSRKPSSYPMGFMPTLLPLTRTLQLEARLTPLGNESCFRSETHPLDRPPSGTQVPNRPGPLEVHFTCMEADPRSRTATRPASPTGLHRKASRRACLTHPRDWAMRSPCTDCP